MSAGMRTFLLEVMLLAIKRERKEELVDLYAELVAQSRAIFLVEYNGMGVKQMEVLRGKIRDANGQLNVTKNTLLIKALEASERNVPMDLLVGQLATSFALGEAPALAKVLIDHARIDEKLVIRGGLVGNQIVTPKEVEQLANLPSLEQLRAQILGLISAPAQNVVSTLTSGVRQVVNVLDAYARSEESAAAEAAEAA
jgi:large subunit ribosomal protein L10